MEDPNDEYDEKDGYYLMTTKDLVSAGVREYPQYTAKGPRNQIILDSLKKYVDLEVDDGARAVVTHINIQLHGSTEVNGLFVRYQKTANLFIPLRKIEISKELGLTDETILLEKGQAYPEKIAIELLGKVAALLEKWPGLAFSMGKES